MYYIYIIQIYIIHIYTYTYIYIYIIHTYHAFYIIIYMGGSVNGIPKNVWFTMENPMKRMIWGYPHFRKTSIYYLVGAFNPSEKCEFVSWDDEILN